MALAHSATGVASTRNLVGPVARRAYEMPLTSIFVNKAKNPPAVFSRRQLIGASELSRLDHNKKAQRLTAELKHPLDTIELLQYCATV
jgi:hypothetical protein